MDQTSFRHLSGSLNKSCVIPHAAFPCQNLFAREAVGRIANDLAAGCDDDDDDTTGGCPFEVPCYAPFDLDAPLCTPLYAGSGTVDLASALVRRKTTWTRQLDRIKVSNPAKDMQTIKTLIRDNTIKPCKRLVHLINHFRRDPEPNFSGTYNHLYTGGNLDVAELDSTLYLIGSDYLKNSPEFNIFNIDPTTNEVLSRLSTPVKKSHPILQISSRINSESLLVLVRQKCDVSLYTLNHAINSNQVNEIWRKKVPSGKLITSIDIHEDCQSIIGADSKCDVHVYNVETKKKVYGFANRSDTRGNWNQVISENHLIYLADRNCIYILDTKAANSKPVSQCSLSEFTADCEDICSMVRSRIGESYTYLGTKHGLFQVDTRMGKSVQKWTHMMNDPPQFLNCVEHENSDLLILQSQNINETIGVMNSRCGPIVTSTPLEGTSEEPDLMYSRSTPCSLTVADDSLRLARMNGLCLHPYFPERFQCAVTGHECVKSKDGVIRLVVGNGCGDVFLRELTQKGTIEPCDTPADFIERVRAYETKIEGMLLEDRDGHDQDTTDLTDVLNGMRESKVGSDSDSDSFVWRYHEMFAEESLIRYRDIIAQRLVKVWCPDAEVDSTIASEVKVLEWLEKMPVD